MDNQQQIDAAVFQKLLSHLNDHKEVQNIDLMILADFCRNCLAQWMVTAAEDVGVSLDYEVARERVYGMPYSQWKEQFQAKASSEQMAAFNAKQQAKNTQ